VTRNRLLIALDVDGTVVGADGVISERVRAAVRAAHERLHHVVLSTGRSPHATVPVIAALGLAGAHAVCSNGAVTLRTRASGEHRYTVVSEATFDPSAVLAALARTVPGCAVAVEMPGRQGFRVTAAFAYELPGGVVTPWERLGAGGACRVIVDGVNRARIATLLDELGMVGVADTTGLGDAVEVIRPGVSKALALERLRTTLGVHSGDTVAVGDQTNDLEMLCWAARGVAMADAPAEVRAMAAEVTGSCADDGLADVLESIVNRERAPRSAVDRSTIA
jgi:hydroxymethylpyrimidine pyrophosphatase-like HAD family hydrolase